MVAFNGRPCISFVISSLASRLRSLDTLNRINENCNWKIIIFLILLLKTLIASTR